MVGMSQGRYFSTSAIFVEEEILEAQYVTASLSSFSFFPTTRAKCILKSNISEAPKESSKG